MATQKAEIKYNQKQDKAGKMQTQKHTTKRNGETQEQAQMNKTGEQCR